MKSHKIIQQIYRLITYNLTLKIGAFFIAILAWILVVNADDPIVPVEFPNVPVNVINREIVTNYGKTYRVDNNTTSVRVIVYAKRSVMDRIKLNPELVTATADMNQMQLESLVPITATVIGFENRIHEAIALPNNMIVTIEDVARHQFPVHVNIIGRPRDGFVVGQRDVSPTTITITGPASLISEISEVVARVDVSGRTRSGDFEAELIIYDIYGVAIDQSLITTDIGESPVMVHIEIYPTKTVPLKFSTTGRVMPGFVVIDVSSEPSTVNIAAPQEVLDQIDEVLIPGSAVSVNGANSRLEIPVDISQFMPEGVLLANPDAINVIVTVQIEQAGTRTVVVPVEAIIVQGLGQNLSVTYSISELDLHFQGIQGLLSLIQPTNLVTIDLSMLTEVGTYTVPFTVTPNVAVENITAFDRIEVTISLRAEER